MPNLSLAELEELESLTEEDLKKLSKKEYEKFARLIAPDKFKGGINLSKIPAPHPGKQQSFAEIDDIDIVIYGGAAGSGKSQGLLLYPLWQRHVDNPGFRGIYFRRTMPMITGTGAVWDKATQLYPLVGATLRTGDHRAVFPSGAEIGFAHLDEVLTVQNYQSQEFAYIAFDELLHYDESQFWYMISRSRSTCGIHPYIRAACNPGPGWVKVLLAPWVDPDYSGLGGRAASGEPRWFARIGGVVTWVPSTFRYPPTAHNPEGDRPKSITFVAASVYDNPTLLAADPGYVTNLLSLDETDKRRLLDGDWTVTDGTYFDSFSRELHVVDPIFRPEEPPPEWYSFFGGLDWGYADPYSFVLGCLDERESMHVLESEEKAKLSDPDQAARVCAMLRRWSIPKDKCLIIADASMWANKREGVPVKPHIHAYIEAGLKCAQAANDPVSVRARMTGIRSWLNVRNRLRIYSVFNRELTDAIENVKYGTGSRAEYFLHDASSHLAYALGCLLASRGGPAEVPDKAISAEERLRKAMDEYEETNKAAYDYIEQLRDENMGLGRDNRQLLGTGL